MGEEETSHMGIDDNNEDDPVIKEIPVFVSRRLENQLYVFQYPLRSKHNKTPLNVKRCFVKPNNQAVKLDIQLNTESPNFDSDKAEEIALRVDGPPEHRKKDKEIFFDSNILDRIQYTSSKTVDDPQNYGVGFYNGCELHITPLKGLLRLKPYYPHLDREKRKDGKAKDQDEEPGPSNAKQIMVKITADSDKWKKTQENSYKKIMERYQEEAWIECDWHPEKSELSDLEKAKLHAENTHEVVNMNNSKDLESNYSEYIRQLVPEDQEEAIIRPSLPLNVVSFSTLRALPLLDQCKMILKDAKIIQFQQLMMLLVGCEGLTAESLLKTLPQVAVLVRGNWIVKSDILFPSNSYSAISGVPADFMCRARDYVLILFTKNQYVERRKVSSVIKIPTEEIKEIFTGISKLRYNKGWELTLPVDIEFLYTYPDVVQRQTLFWEQRSAQLSNFFKESTVKDRKRRKSKSVSEEGTSKIPRKDGQLNPRDNCVTSDTDSGTEKNKSPIMKRNKSSKSETKDDGVINLDDENS